MPESIKVHPDTAEWTCVCGNEAHLDGFWPVIEQEGIGNRIAGHTCVEPTTNSRWNGLYVCAQCLRLIQQDNDGWTAEIVGVMDRRDFEDTHY